VRAVLDAAEKAAEERNVSAVMRYVTDDYGDDNGFDKAKLRDFVRGYFVINPSLELFVRIDSIEFPSPELARVQLGIATMARRSEGETASAAPNVDVDILRLELVNDNDEWRVRRVDRGAQN
jgi:hypothetical protein